MLQTDRQFTKRSKMEPKIINGSDNRGNYSKYVLEKMSIARQKLNIFSILM